MSIFHLRAPVQPFLESDVQLDPTAVETGYAFMGIPFGPPYEPQDLMVCAGAADAVRASARKMDFRGMSHHYNFDWGGPLGDPDVTDCGDVVGDGADPNGIWDRGLDVSRALVGRGVTPLVIGGLDAIPPIVVGAFEEPLHVLHVDSHLDFREEVGGQTRGYSSPIRRIREMPHVERIVQVGLRGMGSARPSDVDEAVAAGNELVTALEIHEAGVGVVLDRLSEDHRWVVTIDCDGLDPTIAPAVGWPEPGGLSYPHISEIVRWLAERDRIAGLIVTEFQPALDIGGITALHIVRLLMMMLGLQRRSAG
ncbi:MAG: arginase family protein [Actinomycetota bacterium]